MELPISPVSYQPDASARWRAVCDGYAALAQTNAQAVEIDAAQCFIDAHKKGVRLANMMQIDARSSLLDQPGFDAQLGAALDAFTQQGSACEMILWREPDVPAWADEAITAAGFVKHQRTIFAMVEYQPAKDERDDLQIIPARAAYPKLHAFFNHQAKAEHHADDTLAEALATMWLGCLDEPSLELLVARKEGQLAASAGVQGIGRHALLWPAWCDSAFRKQGIARVLMHHVLAFCQRAQFADILLDRAVDCWAIPFYESLGMKAVSQGMKYKRAPAG